MARKEDLNFGLKKKNTDGNKDVRERSLPSMTSDDDVVVVILDLDSTEKGKGKLTFALSEVSLVCY